MLDDPNAQPEDDSGPASLAAWEGWFALHCGDRLGGVFPTSERAYVAGVAMYGDGTRVRRIGPGGILEPAG